jgi:hypothetical protein
MISRLLFTCFALILASCAAVQEELDSYGISGDVSYITSHFSPGSPGDLAAFLDTATLERESTPRFPADVHSQPCSRVPAPVAHDGRIHERLVFPSVLAHQDGPDSAVFYVCKRYPSLKGRNIILWVPGMGIADYAFRFIVRFFREELKRDYDIVLYVPPFHLERAIKSEGNGRGFFTADTRQNLRVMFACVQELRTMYAYLHGLGVNSIGAWAGSMGASMILLCGRFEHLNHVCMMIPVLDWRKSVLDNPRMKPVKDRILAAGFDETHLSAAYALISPFGHPLPLDSGRTQIFYARYDQLNDTSIAIGFARSNGIRNIIGYPRSHSTQLFDDSMIKDYGQFLDSIGKR